MTDISNYSPDPSGSVRSFSLTLVIPCYNEENTLVHCVERTLGLASETLSLEIIIVDDGSTDKSLEIGKSLQVQHPEVVLLKHDTNMGKGAALRTGIAAASADFVGIQDADLEYEPLEYRKLLIPLINDEADVVFGSRYLRPDSRKVLYFWHTWMNKSLTCISNMMTNMDISDMETCYKLFRREIIQSMELKENRFGFEPEVVAKVAQAQYRVWEVAISYNPRRFEEGKKIGWKDGVKALYCILHYSAHSAPLPLQLFIYLVIGGISAVANVSLFALFMAMGLSIQVAVVSAFLAAAMVNYFLCIFILFRHNARWSTLGEVIAYFTTLTVMGIFDLAFTVFLINSGWSSVGGKSFATFLGFIGNFLLRKYLVFPDKRQSF